MRIEKIKALSVESVVSENTQENHDDLVKSLFSTLLGDEIYVSDVEDCECCDHCEDEDYILSIKDKIDKVAQERFAGPFKAKKVEKL